MNYWYAARPNEIFLDLDSHRALTRCFDVLYQNFKKRSEEFLPVDSAYLYPSGTANHWHVIVVLRWPLGESKYCLPETKTAWALWMGSDRLRAVYTLQRKLRGCVNTDLLVTKTAYFRMHDAWCTCKGKHKPNKVTKNCKALQQLLRGEAGADYFPRTGHKKRKQIWISYGRVSLKAIKEWRDSNGKAEGLLLTDGTVGAISEK